MEAALLNSLPLGQARAPFRLVVFVTLADASLLLSCTSTTTPRRKLLPHLSLATWSILTMNVGELRCFGTAFRPRVSNRDVGPWRFSGRFSMTIFQIVSRSIHLVPDETLDSGSGDSSTTMGDSVVRKVLRTELFGRDRPQLPRNPLGLVAPS